MAKVKTRTLHVGSMSGKRWKRWQEEPGLPKRHRWNMSRCQIGIMTPWQVRGEMARPMTTHPVRLDENYPHCRHHKGSIVYGADKYMRFGTCREKPFLGPLVLAYKHAMAKMFVSIESRKYEFTADEFVIRKTYVYGVVAIDNPAWYYGIWFSEAGGIPI